MRRVDVYEVSHRVQTTELDHVEFMRSQPLRAPDWQEVWDHENDTPRFVKHRVPVVVSRQTGRPDAYVAIGPELFELLAPAVDVGLHKLCEEQLRAAEGMLAANRGLIERMDVLRGTLERTEGRLGEAYAERRNLGERIGNFHEANVLTRIWRAIRRAI